MARRRERSRRRNREAEDVEETDGPLGDEDDSDDELAALEAELDDDEDSDDEDSDDEDSGDEDSDDEDSGDEDSGDEDSDDEDSGDEDSDDEDSGDEDSDDELAALDAELDEEDSDDDSDEDDELDDGDDPAPTKSRTSRKPQEAPKQPKQRRHGIAERLYSGELSFPFIPRQRVFYLFSAVLILASLLAVGIRGINPGIEFTGGADFQVAVAVDDDTVSTFTDAVVDTGLPDMKEVTVRTVGDDRVWVQTRTLDTTTEVPVVQKAIADAAGVETKDVAYSLIGASWGGQITSMALIALGVFLALVCLVIAVYFRNWKMSIAALVALLHDLVVTIGVYGAVGFVVTPATVIGVLTILGYSLYDTVVVFDKVRENTKNLLGQTTSKYAESANLAVNQVLVRSINTTVIGVLPVAALLVTGVFVLGEGPLKDLALALFVGMIAGAYSSIFIATPLLVQMKRREPDIIKHDRRVDRRRAGGGRERTAVDDGDDDTVGGTGAGELVGAASGTRTPRRELSDAAARRPQPVRQPRSRRRR